MQEREITASVTEKSFSKSQNYENLSSKKQNKTKNPLPQLIEVLLKYHFLTTVGGSLIHGRQGLSMSQKSNQLT